MNFEEDDIMMLKCQFWIQQASVMLSSQEWMFQGKPHEPLRLMILTFHNPIHL
jgi:hypothetical protein